MANNNILKDVINQQQYSMRSTEEVINFISTLMGATQTQNSLNTMDEILEAAEKGTNPRFLMAQDIARNDLYMLFKQNGLNVPIYTINGSDYNIAIIREEDEQKVKTLVNQYLNTKGKLHEVPLVDLQDINFEKSIRETKNLDKYQVVKLKEYLNRTNIAYSIVARDENNFSIFCANKDGKKFSQCLYRTMWDLTGYRGELEKKSIAIEQKTRQDIEEARKSNKDIWVVSADFSHQNCITKLHITPKGYELFDNDELRDSGTARSKSYEENIHNILVSFANPIIIHDKDMEKSNAKVMEIVRKKNKKGPINKELSELAKKEAALKQLAEMKMALIDNSEQVEILSDLYNGEVSFLEYFHIDMINDEHIEEELERMDKYEDAAEMKTEFIERMKDISDKIGKLEIEEDFVDTLSIEGLIDSKAHEIEKEKERQRAEKAERLDSRKGLPPVSR